MDEQTSKDYELFRCAILHRDAEAWAVIHARYRNLLMSWAMRCSAQVSTNEWVADIADQAFARAWLALTPERFANFPNLAMILSYLRTCVTTTIIDLVRRHSSNERVQQAIVPHSTPTPEQVALAELDRATIWRITNELVETPSERVVLLESFVNQSPPRTIFMQYPQFFATVEEVYNTKRNLFARLRRNEELRNLYESSLSV
jgi:DNA-directed RNA polymerase specialized sigma24 family protein